MSDYNEFKEDSGKTENEEEILPDLSNEAFVDFCYQRILGRDADSHGKASYLHALQHGETRNKLLLGFLHSKEHLNRIQQFDSPGLKFSPDRFDYLKYPRKLNLGCGFDLRAGYLNVDLNDFHKPDLWADIRKLDMLPTAYYDEIIAQDVLEHMPCTDTSVALAEWARLLRTGGILKLRVPNIIGLVELFSRPENDTAEQHERLIQCAYGTQAYEGDYHFTAFTERLLDHYLRVAGFTNVTFQPYDEWLLDVVAEKEDFEYAVEWSRCEIPAEMKADSEYLISVRVRNASRSCWRQNSEHGRIAVSYHWHNATNQTVVRNGERTYIPCDVQPGQQLDLPQVRVLAPDNPGTYRLEVSMVREGIAWFEMRGQLRFTRASPCTDRIE